MSDYFLCVVNDFTSLDQRYLDRLTRSLQNSKKTFKELPFRRGMEDLVAKGLRAVVMGQRRGDPWMNDVDAFSPSTEGWPTFMPIGAFTREVSE